MTSSVGGEFHFTLIERTDRHGQAYLFGGLKMLNAVLFIRRDIAVPGRPQRWKAVLKPYQPKPGDEDQDPHSVVWEDEQGEQENDRNTDHAEAGRRSRR